MKLNSVKDITNIDEAMILPVQFEKLLKFGKVYNKNINKFILPGETIMDMNMTNSLLLPESKIDLHKNTYCYVPLLKKYFDLHTINYRFDALITIGKVDVIIIGEEVNIIFIPSTD